MAFSDQELFDILEEDGTPTGRQKPRALVHRDGDLHGASHIFILRQKEGDLQVLLQKRSRNKDSFPGCWDTSSAGHLDVGEGFDEAAKRELQEELGVGGVTPRFLFIQRQDYTSFFHGKVFHDREIDYVYVLWLDWPEEMFRPEEAEIESVKWMNAETVRQALREKDPAFCISPTEYEELLRRLEYGFFEDEFVEDMGFPNQKHPPKYEPSDFQGDNRTVKTIEIHGANAHKTFTKTRVGCRGIVIKDSRMLISHEVNADYYLIPGGGLEVDETPEECCAREVCEETGYVVKPIFHFLTMNEYYEECKYISHYFLCDIIGESKQNLTANEIKRGLTPEWISPDRMLELYSKHNDFAKTNEEKRGAYLREYIALKEYLRNFKA